MKHLLSCLLVLASLSSPAAERVAPSAPATMDERCRTLLTHWKDRFDEEKFVTVVAPPFVLAGNGTARQMASYRDNTVLAAAKALHSLYFKTEPREPILILLFESEGPYKRLAKTWFNDENTPHFGYFRHDNIMLMNVGTGTGTLVHELTHALIKPDFPNVPSWFNEGLASLYEQCSFAPPAIRGLVNWRLPSLQKAIRGDQLRPLSDLVGDPNFYRDDLVGLDYAQARYLMFYLQEKDLLVNYYAAFRDGVKDDPTGLATLKKTVAPQSLEAFEKDWRAWVMTLKFE